MMIWGDFGFARVLVRNRNFLMNCGFLFGVGVGGCVCRGDHWSSVGWHAVRTNTKPNGGRLVIAPTVIGKCHPHIYPNP